MLYGCMALTGTTLAFDLLPFIFIPFIFIPFVISCLYSDTHYAMRWKQIAGALGCCVLFFFLTKTAESIPNENLNGFKGRGEIVIHSVRITHSAFATRLSYQGTLKQWFPKGSEDALPNLYNVPIRIDLPDSANRPSADYRYLIEGRLKQSERGLFLIPDKNTPWTTLGSTWSLAEQRYVLKEHFKKYIHSSFTNTSVTSFLIGIATGEFDDRILTKEFSRFGLQHIMAISGLHFSIIATFLSFLIGLYFSRTIASVLVIGLLTLYFLFIGPSPSVLRAWISIAISMTGIIIGKRGSGINSLGVGLIFVLLWDPHWIGHIGFQFSFASTLAILMGFSHCDKMMQRLFVKRHLSQMVDVSMLDKHGYCLLTFLRQSIALGLAVNLVALPLTLFHFQKFPILGLVYNLFFPFLISFSLTFLMLGCGLSLLWQWSGNWIHSLNESYTDFILNLAVQLPKSFDLIFYYENLSYTFVGLILIMVFYIGIYHWKQEEFV